MSDNDWYELHVISPRYLLHHDKWVEYSGRSIEWLEQRIRSQVCKVFPASLTLSGKPIIVLGGTGKNIKPEETKTLTIDPNWESLIVHEFFHLLLRRLEGEHTSEAYDQLAWRWDNPGIPEIGIGVDSDVFIKQKPRHPFFLEETE